MKRQRGPIARRPQAPPLGAGLSLALGLVVLAGLALRLVYLLHAEPWTDEYYTQLAVQMVVQKGVPVLPSGLFYTHGLPHTYAAAVLSWVFGAGRLAARLPSLLFSLPSMLLAFQMGRRWFHPRVGLLAALLLALSPEAIGWGGQARMYVLWQFFTLAAIYGLHEGLSRGGGQSARVLGLLALAGAILCHVRTLLTIPPLVVGLLAAWWLGRGQEGFEPWRSRHLPPAPGAQAQVWPELVALGSVLLSAALLFWFDRPVAVGESGQLSLANWMDPVRLLADLLLGFMQFLISPYVVLTILALAGSLCLAVRLLRHKPHAHDPALVLLSVVGLGVVIEFSLVSPVVIRVPRYIFDVLPLYLLVAARELDFYAAEIQSRLSGPASTLARWLPLLIVLALFAGPALAAAARQPSAVQPAMEYVGEHLAPGDRIAARLPALPQVALGRCDYFVALQDPFVWQTASGPVDPHLGLPWIGTADGLRQIARESPRLWIIVEDRFAHPYPEILENNLAVAFQQEDYVVYVVEGAP